MLSSKSGRMSSMIAAMALAASSASQSIGGFGQVAQNTFPNFGFKPEGGNRTRNERRYKRAGLDRNGVPHGFSGAKLWRKAIKGTVGRAALR